MEEIKPTSEQIEEKKKANKLLQERMTRTMSKIQAILDEEGMELVTVERIVAIPKRSK